MKLIPILFTTEYRGVFYAEVEESNLDTLKQNAGPDGIQAIYELKNVRCAIRWNTRGGFAELAQVGPNEGSKIGSPANWFVANKITAILDVTEEAQAKWTA